MENFGKLRYYTVFLLFLFFFVHIFSLTILLIDSSYTNWISSPFVSTELYIITNIMTLFGFFLLCFGVFWVIIKFLKIIIILICIIKKLILVCRENFINLDYLYDLSLSYSNYYIIIKWNYVELTKN